MKQIPKVSILIPVYNVSPFLSECLDSLIKQTLKDVEIICVNDGSTDGSLEILKEYAKKDERIVIVSKPNGGLPSARNAGLDVARGEYVGFVDGDDFVELNMFDKMYRTAKRHNSDVVVCGGKSYPEDTFVPKWLDEALSPRDILYKNDAALALFKESGTRPFLWRNLIKKSLIDEYRFRLDEKIVVGEDLAFQFRVFPKANRISVISDKLYYYRRLRSDSIMNSVSYKNYVFRLDKHIELIGYLSDIWEKEGWIKQYPEYFFEWAINFVYWDLIRVNLFDRIAMAKKTVFYLNKYGAENYSYLFGEKTKTQLKYIKEIVNKPYTQTVLSAVIVIPPYCDSIERCLAAIGEQCGNDSEILIYNSCDSSEVYRVLEKAMFENPRICLNRVDEKPLSELLNNAIATAKGKYICFLNAWDYPTGRDFFSSICEAFGNDDVRLVCFAEDREESTENIANYQNSDFRRFAFRTDIVKENRLAFEDYGLLTGEAFFMKYCMLCNSVKLIRPRIFIDERHEKNKVSASEIIKTLNGFVGMLAASKEMGLEKKRNALTEALHSDKWAELIENSASEFEEDDCAENNANSNRAQILELLLRTNDLMCSEHINVAIHKSLIRFIKSQRQTADKMSLSAQTNAWRKKS